MHILIMLRCAILSVHNRKLRCTVVFYPDDQKHILRIDSHPDKALLRVSQLFHTLYCIVKRIAEYVVITGMYRFDYGDETTMHDLAARLNKAGEALKAEGVELLYHNHNCELRHVNAEKRAYDILLEETDPQFVNFEFDSYWFTEGGANALAWMQRLGTRMKLWHINDRGTRISGSAVTPILKTDSMELGTGNMDLDSLMAQALTIGVDAVILESHRNWVDNSPIKSLQLSAEYLKQHG